MKITKQTKLSECSNLINQEVLNTIEGKVDDSYITKFPSIVNNTVGEFIMLLRGDEEYLKQFFLKDEQDITVYEYCAKLKHLKKEIERVSDHLKSLSTKQTVNEIEAAKGVAFPSFEENILIYCQQKFYLNSLKQAEGTLLCDFLLHKKNDMANIKFEKNLRKITEPKFKK